MSLDRHRDIADLILKYVSTVAIVVGGCWAAYTFLVGENTATIIQLTITSETLQYGGGNGLLVVHVKPKNIGKKLVVLDKQRFDVVITKIPANLSPGMLHPQKNLPYHVENLMTRFRDGYELEPGIEYDELVSLIVPAGSVYAIRSQLELGDGTEVDQDAIVRVEAPLPPK